MKPPETTNTISTEDRDVAFTIVETWWVNLRVPPSLGRTAIAHQVDPLIDAIAKALANARTEERAHATRA